MDTTSILDRATAEPLPTSRRLWAPAAGFGLFVTACATPALVLRGPGEAPPHVPTEYVVTGLDSLVNGWVAPWAGVPLLAWYANPLWLVGLVLVARGAHRAARYVLATALVLASTTLLLFWQGLPSEAVASGATSHLERPLVGFFLWVGAMLVPLLAATVERGPRLPAPRRAPTSANRP